MNVIALPPSDTQYTPEELKMCAYRLVIRIRKICRILYDQINSASEEACQYRRAARVLETMNNPFHAARIAKTKALADELSSACSERTNRLREEGRILMDTSAFIDAATTLADRCELLNINVADRDELTEEDGIAKLIFLHGLEDSAMYRKQDYLDRPLNNALRWVFMDFLTETPEGRKVGDSLFEAGGMFEFLPVYKQRPDGTMERCPPPLRLA